MTDALTEVAHIVRQTSEEAERENKRAKAIAMLEGWLADESDGAEQTESLKATMAALQTSEERIEMDLAVHCYELADLALHRLGYDDAARSEQLGDLLKQTVEDFLDSLDGDDDEVEGRLHDEMRARACNGER